MGMWLASVLFPDGRTAYARYYTGICGIGGELYGDYSRRGEMMASGFMCEREEVKGEPLPEYRDRPMSALDALVVVRVEEEPDRSGFISLYCPQQERLVGPLDSILDYIMQTEYRLVAQHDLLHLVYDHSASDHCLCGQPEVGEEIPYARYEGPGSEQFQPDPPPWRNLYAEWAEGKVCRQCLWIAKEKHEKA